MGKSVSTVTITRPVASACSLREMQRAARHTRADTTVGYDQSDRSFHRDPTFVLMTCHRPLNCGQRPRPTVGVPRIPPGSWYAWPRAAMRRRASGLREACPCYGRSASPWHAADRLL